jgi:hypothetical protein
LCENSNFARYPQEQIFVSFTSFGRACQAHEFTRLVKYPG